MKCVSLGRLWAASIAFASLLGSYQTPLLCMQSAAGSSSIPLEDLQAVNQAALQACIDEWATRNQEPRPSLDASALGQEDCGLCLAPLVDHEKRHHYVALPCQGQVPHLFHQECIQPYFTQLMDCPMCRRQATAQELEACGAVNAHLAGYTAVLQMLLKGTKNDCMLPYLTVLGVAQQLNDLDPAHATLPARVPALAIGQPIHIADITRRTIFSCAHYAWENPTVNTSSLLVISRKLITSPIKYHGWGHALALELTQNIVDRHNAQAYLPASALNVAHDLFTKALGRVSIPPNASNGEILQLLAAARTLVFTAPEPLASAATNYILAIAHRVAGDNTIAQLLSESPAFLEVINSQNLLHFLQARLVNTPATRASAPNLLLRLGRLIKNLSDQLKAVLWNKLELLGQPTWDNLLQGPDNEKMVAAFFYLLGNAASNANDALLGSAWNILASLAQPTWDSMLRHLNDALAIKNFISCLGRFAKRAPTPLKSAIWDRLNSLDQAAWDSLLQHLDDPDTANCLMYCLISLAESQEDRVKIAVLGKLLSFNRTTWEAILRHNHSANRALALVEKLCPFILTTPSQPTDQAAANCILVIATHLAACNHARDLFQIRAFVEFIESQRLLTYMEANLTGERADARTITTLLHCLGCIAENANQSLKTAILNAIKSLSNSAWNSILQHLDNALVAAALLHAVGSVSTGTDAELGRAAWAIIDPLWDRILPNLSDAGVTRNLLWSIVKMTGRDNEQPRAAIWNKLATLNQTHWNNILQQLDNIDITCNLLACLSQISYRASAELCEAVWGWLKSLTQPAWDRIVLSLDNERVACALLYAFDSIAVTTTQGEIKGEIWRKCELVWDNILRHLDNTLVLSPLMCLLGNITITTDPNDELKLFVWQKLAALDQANWDTILNRLDHSNTRKHLLSCLENITRTNKPDIKAAANEKLEDVIRRIELLQNAGPA